MSTVRAVMPETKPMPPQPMPLTGETRCRVERLSAGALFSVQMADLGEFCDFAAGWNLDHQFAGHEKRHISASGFVTSGLQLAFVHQTGDCCWQGTSPNGSVTLQVPLGGAQSFTHCGRNIEPLQMAMSRSGEAFELLAQSGTSHLRQRYWRLSPISCSAEWSRESWSQQSLGSWKAEEE